MNLTPAQLQKQINDTSDESFQLYQELAGIEERSTLVKIELMKTCKSGKEVEMRWNATDDGRREIYLKTYLRGLGHKRSALILEQKANNGNAW